MASRNTKKSTNGSTVTDKELDTFNSEVEAGRLPFTGKAPEKWYAHPTLKGFYVVVSKPNAEGHVQRWYAVRYGEASKNAKGEMETLDRKPKLGPVGLLTYGKALEQATAQLERAREARVSGKPVLPTLKAAFDDFMHFKTKTVADEHKLKPRTTKDYNDRFNILVPADWHSLPIDELTPEEWTKLRTNCITAASWDERGRKPVGESRFDGFMKGAVSGLYRRQRTFHPLLVNPVPVMRNQKTLSSIKQKHDFIPTEKLPAVWAFLENEVRPPQRDIVLIGLLTGWRLQLMTKIPLNRVNAKRRAVEWRDTDEGGPYAEKDGPSFEYPVSDLLWEQVFAPRLAAAKPGQKYLIESGRRPGEPFKDVRDSVNQLDPIVGCHVTASVLRKTFMSLAPASGASQRSISHNAMHKTSAGSAATGGSDTTSGTYQKRDFVSMKEGANKYSAWFAQQVGLNAAPTPAVPGLTEDKLAQLQQLAALPPELIAKMLKMADAFK